MSPQSWQLSVANSTCASQECLFRLYTDPRTRPLDVQAVLGSPVWRKDMWNLLPTINVDEPQYAERRWSVYVIKLEESRGHSVEGGQDLSPGQNPQVSQVDQGTYVGSAQSQSAGSGSLAGEISRLVSGHEHFFQLSTDDIWELRSTSAESSALYVHTIGAREEVPRSYHSTASFPVIESASWFQARIRQSIQRLENDQAIILGSWNMSRPKGPRASIITGLSSIFRKKCGHLPGPVLRGMAFNQVLPSSRAQQLHSQSPSIAVQGLCDALRLFHEKTSEVHLDAWNIRCIFSENEGLIKSSRHILPSSVRQFVRMCYADVLRKKGLKYERRSCQMLRLLFPILWGLAQPFDASGLVLGEYDAEHILHWAAVDWCRLAQLAQKIAPEGEEKTYSPAFCAQKGTFDRANTTFRRRFPYKPNFDAIRDISCDFFLFDSF